MKAEMDLDGRFDVMSLDLATETVADMIHRRIDELRGGEVTVRMKPDDLREILDREAVSRMVRFVVAKPVVVCFLGNENPHDAESVGIARCSPQDVKDGLWDPVLGMALAYDRACERCTWPDYQVGRGISYWVDKCKHGRRRYASWLAHRARTMLLDGQHCVVDVMK